MTRTNSIRLVLGLTTGLVLLAIFVLIYRNQTQGNVTENHTTAILELELPELRSTEPAQHSLEEKTIDKAFLAFQTGDYATAVKELKKRYLNNPTEENKNNLTESLLALAVFRIQELKNDEAEELLDEAILLGSAKASELLAGLKIKQGNLDIAKNLLDEMYLKYKSPTILKALIDLNLRQEELQKAEQYLEQLNNEDDSDFHQDRLTRLSSKQKIQKRMNKLESNYLILYYDEDDRSTPTERLLNDVSKIHQNLSRLFLGPLKEPWIAHLIPDEHFMNYTGAPPWAGAIFDGTMRFKTPKTAMTTTHYQRLLREFKHEATHAYLFQFCGDILPSWIGEGLAQHQEGLSVTSSLLHLRSQNLLHAEAPHHFNESFIHLPKFDVRMNYARSHILIEAIQKRHGKGVWHEVLRQTCEQKNPLGSVLEQMFGASYGSSLWREYFEVIKTL